MMSVVSSTTPLIVENSCNTPSILTVVTAAPGSDERRIRLRELPSVTPYPRSSGSTINLPKVSLISSVSIFGFSISIISEPSLCPYRENKSASRQMRRLFGGRQPLCGMGVTSLIKLTSKPAARSEEHTSELQSRENLVCRLLLEKK